MITQVGKATTTTTTAAVAATAAAPDLVLIDLNAPLEECLRRLQAQLARVWILAAQETSACPGNSPARFFDDLLQNYTGASESATMETAGERVTALRRRVTQRLRRLSEEQHTALCVARTSLSDEDGNDDHCLSAMAVSDREDAAVSLSHKAGGDLHDYHGELQQQQQQSQPHKSEKQAGEEEEDLFSWVTEPAATHSTSAGPALPSALAAHTTAPPTATATVKTVPDVDATLRRIAHELADVVEARYRYADRLDSAHQQLLQLQQHMKHLMTVRKDDSASTRPSSSLRLQNSLHELLSYRPSYKIASDDERDVWQRAWQAVLPAEASAHAPPLRTGDAIELVDVAVLAHVNAQRFAALQQRWRAVQCDYEGVVEQLNRRLAQAALQLEELERCL